MIVAFSLFQTPCKVRLAFKNKNVISIYLTAQKAGSGGKATNSYFVPCFLTILQITHAS
jgi:hypothetical protein